MVEHAGVRGTKTRVLAVAREMLPVTGVVGLTYTLLAERAGVTRQTLYRHWPTREQLLAELVLTGPEVGYPAESGDLRTTVIDFLTSLRAGMAVPATAAALTTLSAQADRDVVSDQALATVADDRRQALNLLLRSTGQTVDDDDFALLCGPILYRRFIARTPVNDRFIATTVDTWLARKASSSD
ncbi:MAG: TetR/AcrR family transcriptional regulator [Terracoccus sp.]